MVDWVFFHRLATVATSHRPQAARDIEIGIRPLTGAGTPGRGTPVLLVKWYDFTRWLLERIDSFRKNQPFVFGTRLADHALDVLETLVEASYSRHYLASDFGRPVRDFS